MKASLILGVLCLLQAGVRSLAFSCNGKPNGNYKDPDNCNGYITCSNGHTYKMPCPAGLVFNDQLKQCVWPHQAPPCPADSPTTAQPTTAQPTTAQPTTAQPTTPSYSDDSYCKHKDDGDYIDPTTCYGFISCSNGHVYHMPCPSNLKWDDNKKRCEYVGYPACGDHGHPPYRKCDSLPNHDNLCHGKDNGNYPDPSNCHGYIACSNGLVYHMPCPNNLKWNDQKKYCDYPANANPQCPGPNNPTPPAATPSPPSGNLCASKNNGDYPDPTNCHGFLTCSNHITYHMPCPANLLWNDHKKICDYPQHAYPGCNNSTNKSPSFNCSHGNGNQSGFCQSKANGNYPNPNNCNGYIACSNGYVYYMPCPSGLKWNNAKKLCDWPKHATGKCAFSDDSYCKGKANGDYIDPTTCYGFISCSNGHVHHMPCPAKLKWDDKKKRCEYVGYPACGPGNPPQHKCVKLPNHHNLCHGKADGDYPDPSNCHGFIACANGLVYHMPCPANLKWNDQKKYCDWPANAYPQCPGPNNPPPPAATPSPPSGNLCASKNNGDYPDPTNCHGFLTCSNHITYHMPCPANLLWNDHKKICDYPQYAYPGCNNSTNKSPSFNCSHGNGNQSGFCQSKDNGNYPDSNNCNGYIACANGYVYYMPCPANLKWNDAKKLCDWPQHANPPCGDATTTQRPVQTTVPTTVPTTKDNYCAGKKDGNYPDPAGNCTAYITCTNGISNLRACNANFKWNDIKKRCDFSKFATGKCSPYGCDDLLSQYSCRLIDTRGECQFPAGWYCPKTCHRC